MSQKLGEYELPSHYTLEDTKVKVKGWLNTIIGRDYRLKVLSERNITLTKEKHDLRICGVSCALMCIVPFLVILLMIPFMLTSIQGAFLMVGVLIFAIGAIMLVGIGYFCLNPQRAKFTVQFTDDQPMRVIVFGEGEIMKARGDYESLKTAILRERSPGNDSIGIW